MKLAHLCNGKVFTLGTLFSWGGWYPVSQHGGAGGILVALDKVNLDNITFSTFHTNGHRLEFAYADTKCDRSVGLPFVPDMFYGREFPKVDAFIGPGCSIICEPAGLMVKKWNIPMVSFVCTSTKLSNRSLYPTFARTVAPSFRTAPFFASIMHNYNFRRVAIFYSSDQIQVLSAVAIKEVFEKQEDIKLTHFYVFEPGSYGKEQEYRKLVEAKTTTRGESDNHTVHALITVKFVVKISQSHYNRSRLA